MINYVNVFIQNIVELLLCVRDWTQPWGHRNLGMLQKDAVVNEYTAVLCLEDAYMEAHGINKHNKDD